MTILVIAATTIITALKAATTEYRCCCAKIGGEIHVLVADAGCRRRSKLPTCRGVAVGQRLPILLRQCTDRRKPRRPGRRPQAAGYSHILAPDQPPSATTCPYDAIPDWTSRSFGHRCHRGCRYLRPPIYAGNALATVERRCRQGHHRSHHGLRCGRHGRCRCGRTSLAAAADTAQSQCRTAG